MELNKIFFASLACCALFINAIYLFQSSKNDSETEYVGFRFIKDEPFLSTNDTDSAILYRLILPKNITNQSNTVSTLNKLKSFVNLEELKEDYTNPHAYVYLTNPGAKMCANNRDVLLLAFVTIAVDNFEQRSIIRNTWSKQSLFPEITTVFMVGLSKSDEINRRVHLEHQLYGDVVQESFMDTYYNLTLKTIMGFKWASNYCKNAKFVMKIDDDVVVNSYKLIKFLRKLTTEEPNLNNTIMGRFFSTSPVNRNPNSKFYTPMSEYALDKYHPYCDGPVYIATQDLPARIYEKSLYTKPFKLEDVYIGMLGKQLDTKFKDLTKQYQIMKRKFKIKDLINTDEYLFYYTPNPTYFSSLWYYLISLLARPDPNFYFSVNPLDYEN